VIFSAAITIPEFTLTFKDIWFPVTPPEEARTTGRIISTAPVPVPFVITRLYSKKNMHPIFTPFFAATTIEDVPGTDIDKIGFAEIVSYLLRTSLELPRENPLGAIGAPEPALFVIVLN
jgi:hypothetical protein